MRRNLEKVIACFKEFGFRPAVDEFQDRLKMQKIVYILQKMGVKSGFSFGLHVRGPYSPDLTEDIYRNKCLVEKLKTGCRLSGPEVKIINRYKSAVDSTPAQLEVISTYIYLKDSWGLHEGPAVRKLKEMKPFYSEADIAVGISRAKGPFFKPTGRDLKELQEEVEP
jgi:uncharacterized protein YwgA